MSLVPPVPRVLGDASEALGSSDRTRRVVAALGVQLATDRWREPLSKNNSTLLAAGRHAAFTMAMPQGVVSCLPAAQVDGGVVLDGDVKVVGALLRHAAPSRARLVTVASGVAVLEGCILETVEQMSDCVEHVLVKAGATAVLRGCRFVRQAADLPTFLDVEAGARAILIGCIFQGNSGTAGNVIANAAAAADVQCIGCVNDTTHAYGAVTTIGSF